MTDRRERQMTGGFASRLREVIDAHGSANSLARAIQRSEGAVRKWLRGESEPNVTDLRTLCEQTQTSLDWLVTGRGPRESIPSASLADHENLPLSLSLLEAILEAVESQYHSEHPSLTPAKRALLITTLYSLSRPSHTVDPEAVVRLIKLAG